MEFPQDLKEEIKNQSETEFNNPSPDFGDRLRAEIHQETDQVLPEGLTCEFNDWQNLWLEPELTWGDFVRWVWARIKAWWKELWD